MGAALTKIQQEAAELKGTPEEIDRMQAQVLVAQKAKEEADAQMEAIHA